MGRPGTSSHHSSSSSHHSSSSSHHSSSHHSSSHSSSGHRIGSSLSSSSRPTHTSSRPTGSHSSSIPSFGGSHYNSSHNSPPLPSYGGSYHHSPPPPPPHRHTTYRTFNTYNTYNTPSMPSYGTYGGTTVRRRTPLASIVVLCICVILFIFLISTVGRNSSGGVSQSHASTIVREKLTNVPSFSTQCIIDDVGWFDNKSNAAKSLKGFYEETGVQPYIYLKAYDSNLITDEQKDDYAVDYFETKGLSENTALFIYFCEKDADNDMGYMAFVPGFEAETILDDEAQHIFWNYIDRYWTDSSLSMDDVFIKTFNSTSKAIMHVSTTTKDITKTLIIFLIFGIIFITICVIFARQRQKALETERILNAPLGPNLSNGNNVDNLINSYNNSGNNGISFGSMGGGTPPNNNNNNLF